MKITPLSLNQTNSMNRKNQNFGMSLSITKATDNSLRKAVRDRSLDPIRWLSAAYVMSQDAAHYNIIKQEPGFLSFTTNYTITRVNPGEEARATTASASDLIEKIATLDRSIGERIEIASKQIAHNILENIKYISGGKEIINVEPRKIEILPPISAIVKKDA